MTSEEQHNWKLKHTNVASNIILGGTVALFYSKNRKSFLPKGTATVLKSRNKLYLLTAMHNLYEDGAKEANKWMYLELNNEKYFIAGNIKTLSLKSKNHSKFEIMDVSVIELDPIITEQLIKNDLWLPLSLLNFNYEFSETDIFIFCGFPDSGRYQDKDNTLSTRKAVSTFTLFKPFSNKEKVFDPVLNFGLVY